MLPTLTQAKHETGAGIAWTLRRQRPASWLEFNAHDEGQYDSLDELASLQQAVQALIQASAHFPNLRLMVNYSTTQAQPLLLQSSTRQTSPERCRPDRCIGVARSIFDLCRPS